MRYRPEIDGLRALAVVPVILFHAGFQLFGGGYVGVDVFFVISGYLITTLILAELEAGSFSIAGFYERRARRILPALFVVMAACLPFAWFWLLPNDMEGFALSVASVALFASNFLFWWQTGYFDTAAELKPLLHTWSLAVEEQFYVLYPLLLLLAWRLGRRSIPVALAIVALASLALAQYGVTAFPQAAFFLLPTRAWELALGALAALYLRQRERHVGVSALPGRPQDQFLSLAGVALIVFSVFAFDKQTPFPGLHALVPTIGTALLIIFCSSRTLVARLLASKPFVGVGLVSYSAYLWHQPLFAFARHRGVDGSNKLFFAGLAVASLLLAYASWKYVEIPFRGRQRFSRRQIFVGALLGSLSFAAIGVAGYVTEGFGFRLSKSGSDVLRTSKDVSRFSGDGDLQGATILGDPARLKGVILGDSHAGSIAQALGESLSRQGVGLTSYIKGGCPPVRGLFRFDIPTVRAACDEHYSAVFRKIATDDSVDVVVISARFTLYLESDRFDNGEGGVEVGPTPQVIYDGLEFLGGVRDRSQRKERVARQFVRDVEYLLEAGKRVVLVYPIPEVGWDTPTAGMKKALVTAGDVALSTSLRRFNERNEFAVAVLDSLGHRDNLKRVFPHRVLCDTYVKDRCAAIVGSQSFYRDSNHLTNIGARLFADEIAKAVIE